MSSNPMHFWSEDLQRQTRETIETAPITPDGFIHLKHPVQGHAYLEVAALCHSSLLIHSKPSGEKLWFDDVDALLQAGWAMD